MGAEASTTQRNWLEKYELNVPAKADSDENIGEFLATQGITKLSDITALTEDDIKHLGLTLGAKNRLLGAWKAAASFDTEEHARRKKAVEDAEKTLKDFSSKGLGQDYVWYHKSKSQWGPVWVGNQPSNYDPGKAKTIPKGKAWVLYSTHGNQKNSWNNKGKYGLDSKASGTHRSKKSSLESAVKKAKKELADFV